MNTSIAMNYICHNDNYGLYFHDIRVSVCCGVMSLRNKLGGACVGLTI